MVLKGTDPQIMMPTPTFLHLCTDYFAGGPVEHPGALSQTSNVQQCFFWTSSAASSRELRSRFYSLWICQQQRRRVPEISPSLQLTP